MMETARTKGPDMIYGKSDQKVACSNSELGLVNPLKIFRAAGELGARGNASTKYIICVRVKKLTPRGKPKSGNVNRGPCKYARVPKKRLTYLKRNSSVILTVRPIHSTNLRLESML